MGFYGLIVVLFIFFLVLSIITFNPLCMLITAGLLTFGFSWYKIEVFFSSVTDSMSSPSFDLLPIVVVLIVAAIAFGNPQLFFGLAFILLIAFNSSPDPSTKKQLAYHHSQEFADKHLLSFGPSAHIRELLMQLKRNSASHRSHGNNYEEQKRLLELLRAEKSLEFGIFENTKTFLLRPLPTIKTEDGLTWKSVGGVDCLEITETSEYKGITPYSKYEIVFHENTPVVLKSHEKFGKITELDNIEQRSPSLRAATRVLLDEDGVNTQSSNKMISHFRHVKNRALDLLSNLISK